MQSKLYFDYLPNGNLKQFTAQELDDPSATDHLFQGQVGTAEYRISIDNTVPISERWLPTDSVFIAFERPDGKKTNQKMELTPDGSWWYMSNGWETDVNVSEHGAQLKVSFIMRRYSTLSAGLLVSAKTTETVNVTIYPSAGYTPLDITNDVADAVFAELARMAERLNIIESQVQDLAESVETQIADFTESVTQQIEDFEESVDKQVDELADIIETMGSEYTSAYNDYELVDGGFKLETISGMITDIIPTGGGTAVYTQMAGYRGEIAADSLGWIPNYQNLDIVGYTFIVTAGTHGQIKDGATAADLSVNWSIQEGVDYPAYDPIFTVKENGDVVVSTLAPLSLIIRVWNGRGIKGESGTSYTSAEVAEVTITDDKTVTEVTLAKDDGTADTLEIEAQNGNDVEEFETLSSVIVDNQTQNTVRAYMRNGDTHDYIVIAENGKDGVSISIMSGIYYDPNDPPPGDLPPGHIPLPDFADTAEGQGYVVDDGDIAGQYDLYMHNVGGADWNIIDNWGGIPGQKGADGKSVVAARNVGERSADGYTTSQIRFDMSDGSYTQTFVRAKDGDMQTITFDTTGWTASDSPLGAVMKVLTLPTDKAIIGAYTALNGKNYAFGNYSENTIYANEPFSGYVKLG